MNKKANKPVLLLAYTNFNFGDDMFIKTICSVYPDVKFELEAPKEYIKLMSSIKNLKIIEQTQARKMAEKFDNLIIKILPLRIGPIRSLWLNKYCAIVYVIGGLFDDDDLWENQVSKIGKRRYKNAILKKSFSNSVPYYLLGCNMTRIRSIKYVELMNYVFQGIKDVCFRDKYSYNNFKLNNTRYAPDLVFNYPIKKSEHSLKKYVLISVWGVLLRCDIMPQWKWAEGLWHTYEKFLLEIINYFCDQGISIKLLSLCENEGDFEACELIKCNAKKSDISILNYNGNTDEIVDSIAAADFVIGTRFHSVVLAMSSNTPVYPVAYESKTLQLIKDIEFTAGYSDIQKLNDNEVEKVIDSYKHKNEFMSISTIKLKAREQFSELNKLLKDGELDESK